MMPYEVIIVDNGSTDGTATLVDQLIATADLRVRYAYEPRNGLNAARDTGAKMAQGEMLAYLDDDAIADPRWLEYLSEGFAAFPNVEVVAGQVSLLFEDRRPHWLTAEAAGYLSSTGRFGTALRFLTDEEYPVGANMAFLRTAWEKQGGFGNQLGRNAGSLRSNAEFELVYKIRQAGGKVLYTPRARVLHRVPPQRLTWNWFLRRSFWQGRSDAIWDRSIQRAHCTNAVALLVTTLAGVGRHGWRAAAYLVNGETAQAFNHTCFGMHALGYGVQTLGQLHIPLSPQNSPSSRVRLDSSIAVSPTASRSSRSVSIVVCTRNRAALLPKVVAQLERQEYPLGEFEVVIVDNASTDNTQEMVQELARHASIPIRDTYEPLPGVTAARNCGAANARYPYVAYLDDDCAIGSDWLYRLMQGFDWDKDVVAVGGLVLLAWLQGRPYWMHPALESYLGATNSCGDQPRILGPEERIVEFNMAVDRKAFQKAGGFYGMEQFTHQHLGASEGLPLFENLHRNQGKLAFAPAAVVFHQVQSRATRRWMVRRGFWQGVADAVLAHVVRHRPRLGLLTCTRSYLIPAGLHLLRAMLPIPSVSASRSMYELTLSAAYLGRLLGELRVVGDWTLAEATARAARVNGRLQPAEDDVELVPS